MGRNGSPDRAQGLLTYVSTLRNALGEGVIVTSGGSGWLLATRDVDAAHFGQHVRAGREALTRGEAAAAEVAPEFTVGLFFAEAITDLHELTRTERVAHSSRLAAMASRFPRIVLWQCLIARSEAAQIEPETADEVRRLSESLVSREMRDGHWLTACCVLTETAAVVADTTSARLLVPALEPYADDLAVAGRVAAFRGSVSHPLGLLAHTLGDDDGAERYLRASARTHERIGAIPFHDRVRAALTRPK